MRPVRLIPILLLLLSVLAACDALAADSSITVRADEVAVVYAQDTGALEDTLYEGSYTINPMQQSVMFYPLFRQVYTFRDGQMSSDAAISGDAIDALTADGTEVRVSLSLVFQINADEIDVIFDSWANDDYRTGYIRPTARRVVREVMASYPDIVLTDLPDSVLQQEIERVLRAEFEANGFLLQRVDLMDVIFPEG